MQPTGAVPDASVPGVAWLAVACEVVGLLEEEAVCVLVTECLLSLAHAAPVGALLGADGAHVGGRSVWRTLVAVGLLGLVLVEPAPAELASVQGRV